MVVIVAVLLVLAVFFATLRAFAVTAGRVDFGWLSLACLFAGVWMLPALTAVTR